MENLPNTNERIFRKRNADDYLKLGRGLEINHLQTEKTKLDPKHKYSDFFDSGFKQILKWVYYSFKNRFGKRYPYPSYENSGHTGIYKINASEPVVIALAADWATDTFESDTIAMQMDGHHPDYTIHLGDTYFVGTPFEIKNNFTNPNASWPKGKLGSFAVLGNHEMYARGIAFFKELLPSLGARKSDGSYEGQKAGYFCIENEHWRILGLDTGYNSIGKIPVLDMLPFFSPKSQFEESLMKWLIEVVRLGDPNDKRGIVVLTHHQYVSAFKNESEYQAPASQLASLIGKDRKILWLWGHEHKFSMFSQVQVKDGVTAYGRCVGHGGMPVELDGFKLNSKLNGYSKLVMYDSRQRPETNANPLGYNGYAVLKLHNDSLEIEYHDISNKLLSETWKVDANGEIKGDIQVPESCPLQPVNGQLWKNVVA